MKKLLGIAGALCVAVVTLSAQGPFLVAPSMLHYAEGDSLVPVWVQDTAGLTKEIKVEIYDIYGSLVWDSTGNIAPQAPFKWYGTTNGGRKVQSGQYMLIIKLMDQGFENVAQREWVGVVW